MTSDPAPDNDLGGWQGIHPRRWTFGWVVTKPVHPSLGQMPRYLGYRAFTRKSAERMARRLNRKAEERFQWAVESGQFPDRAGADWYVLGRIKDHPLRHQT